MSDLSLPDPDDGAPDEGLGGFDMGALLEQAMGMQQQLMEAQSAAAEQVVEGQAGGGAVVVRVSGAMVFESVTIAPEAVDPDDVGMLQDLVLAALHDAMDEVAALQQSSMGGLDLAGMGGLGDLGGLLGGDAIDISTVEPDAEPDETS
jgi:DNA-binding YbaB/EbfC family protein